MVGGWANKPEGSTKRAQAPVYREPGSGATAQGGQEPMGPLHDNPPVIKASKQGNMRHKPLGVNK
eukprot:12416627-Karenia_brevis.AAC.1